jgi:hypothetical protein
MCIHKKTIYILEQKYGNNGYAFWFKLLEMLGSTEGHYLDLNNDTTWEFLQAKTHIEADLCTEILNLLAKLEAIDPELWNEKIVWSQNFVDGITDVYKNRRVEIPVKPDNYIQKPRQAIVSTGNNPQTKLKESKVKESKEKYADFVTMTKEEYQKLIEQFNERGAKDRIERLSLYKGSTGKKYASDYLTILSWERKNKDKSTHSSGLLPCEKDL